MITVYSQTGCPKCKRVRQWFKDNNFEYKSRSLLSALLDSQHFSKLLEALENMEQIADLSEMDPQIQKNVQTVYEYLRQNPSALYRPLVVSTSQEADRPALEAFKQYLQAEMSHQCPLSCPNLSFCTKVREGDHTVLAFRANKHLD